MKRKYLLLSLALAGSSAWGADLLQLYKEALGYDAQYAAARFSLDAGREKDAQGLAGLLPNISAGANTTWNDAEYTRFSDPRTTSNAQFNSHGWSVRLTQPIFRWQNFVQYDQSKLQVIAAEAQFSLARQDIALRVSQAYFDVLLAQESVAFARSQKEAIAEQLKSAKTQFEVGTATVVDTHEAQARYDLAVAQELAIQNDLEVKRQTLRQIVGNLPGGGLKALRADVQMLKPQPEAMEKWEEAAERNNPAVQASQANKEIADKEVSRQRAGHYPTLDAVIERSQSVANQSVILGVGSDARSTTASLQLSIPIFAGGSVLSRTREAVALRDKAAADLDHARRSAVLGARQAYLGATNGLAQVKAYEQGLVSSLSALDSSKLGYEVGVRVNVDVLNAQQQVFSTRRDLARARYDTINALLKLKAAAGSLSEEDIQAVNALLEK